MECRSPICLEYEANVNLDVFSLRARMMMGRKPVGRLFGKGVHAWVSV